MLSIEPSVIIFTVINFLLFMLIINGLLFKPLRRFMRERDERIAAGKDAARTAAERLQKSEEEFSAQTEECRKNAVVSIDTAIAQNSAAQTEMLAQEALKTAEDRKNEISRLKDEEQNLLNELLADMPEYTAIVKNRIAAAKMPGEK